jgi:sugar phosphate isomerase/epimerase
MSTDKVAIEFISALGQPPVQYVELVARLGCPYIGMGLAPVTANPHKFPQWALHMDAQLRRDTKQALRDHGVSISIGEGFLAFPQGWMIEPEPGLDVMRELGAPVVNVVNLDGDESRAFDRIAAFVELARSRGLRTVFEFLAGQPFGTVQAAAALARKVGGGFSLVIDMMHVVRSGGTAADLAALDPELIGYVQVCDAPLAMDADYGDASANQRMTVGEGAFPILDMLNALPRDRVFGVEAPLRDKAEAGVPLYDALKPSVATTRALLAARHG